MRILEYQYITLRMDWVMFILTILFISMVCIICYYSGQKSGLDYAQDIIDQLSDEEDEEDGTSSDE